jgi:NADPH2:quinone reductase
VHAVRLHAFGPAENLRYEPVPDPSPRPGEARIRVAASGVHLVDTSLRRGEAMGPLPLPELPAIPGREVAGVIDAVGPDVDAAWVGRRVVAHLGVRSGGYAELAVREVASLHELPAGLEAPAAVAMIGTGRTALGVLEVARVEPDDVVLVTAAAGGVGSLLVQGARNRGATVIGVAGGPDKVARVRALGADAAIDYAQPGWPQAVRDALDGLDVTLAFDSVGGEAGASALGLLGSGGRLVVFGWSSGRPTPLSVESLYGRGVTVALGQGPVMRPGGLRRLEHAALAEAASGRLVPLVGDPFALSDAAGAHTALETRRTVGKVVLVP